MARRLGSTGFHLWTRVNEATVGWARLDSIVGSITHYCARGQTKPDKTTGDQTMAWAISESNLQST
eukprot:4931302-Lingulodinium_polyedra.AAC.1